MQPMTVKKTMQTPLKLWFLTFDLGLSGVWIVQDWTSLPAMPHLHSDSALCFYNVCLTAIQNIAPPF